MIYNLNKKNYLAMAPENAITFFQRMRGMIGRHFSEKCDAMVFYRCHSVHSCFMTERFDLIFLDSASKVSAVYPDVAPWRFCVPKAEAVCAVEFPAGTIERTGCECGDAVNIIWTTVPDATEKGICEG